MLCQSTKIITEASNEIDRLGKRTLTPRYLKYLSIYASSDDILAAAR